jgi:hypothetical protein
MESSPIVSSLLQSGSASKLAQPQPQPQSQSTHTRSHTRSIAQEHIQDCELLSRELESDSYLSKRDVTISPLLVSSDSCSSESSLSCPESTSGSPSQSAESSQSPSPSPSPNPPESASSSSSDSSSSLFPPSSVPASATVPQAQSEVQPQLKRISKHYSDGSRYDGEIDCNTGKRHGAGNFVNRHGDEYRGGWTEDRRHGSGVYEWKSGDRYEGEWKNGAMNGRGTFQWANGDSYSGDWVNGKMHGIGTKRMANGDSYNGEWKNDKANGKGIKEFKCGDRHEGSYVDDRRHGPGTYYWSTGDKYTGNWESGKMSGHGTKTMANGDSYTGQWKNDKAEGHGTKIFSSGDSHTGEYLNDYRHGFGVYRWVNGDRFEGYWFNGEQKGRGSYYYANKDIFKGMWFNGKKHGRGIFTSYSQQCSYTEKWDHGIRVERVACKFYPSRMLRTSRDEQELSNSAAVVQSQSPDSEAARIRSEIDRLKSQLAAIQGPVQANNAENRSAPMDQGESPVAAASTSQLTGPNADSAPALLEPRDASEVAEAIASASPLPSRSRPRTRRSSGLPEEATCKVCYDNPINTVLIRCGHICCCLDCSSMLERCPLCRRQIDEVIQTFKS